MLKKIYIISFIFSFSVALTTYVNSSLLEKTFGDFYVGILYIGASLIALVLLGLTPKIVNRLGAYKLSSLTLSINVLASIVLITTKNNLTQAISFFVFFASIPLIYFCLDLFTEHFSKTSTTGHNRGLYLLAVNSGWLFAPLVVGSLVRAGHFEPVYSLAQAVALVALIFLLIFINKYHDPKYFRPSIFQTFKSLQSKPQIKNAIKLNFLLQFFYAFMVIYTPIYLSNYFNLSWQQIGIIFSIMLSAFVIFQYPVGVLTDKNKISNIRAIWFSLIIIVLALISLFSLQPATSIILIGLIIFMSRVGAAIYEASVEYFFFKRSDDTDSNYISLFRDMSPLAYVIAPALGTLIIKIMPLKNIFIILATFLIVAGFLIIKQIKHYEEYEKTN